MINVVALISAIKDLSVEEVAGKLQNNAHTFYGL